MKKDDNFCNLENSSDGFQGRGDNLEVSRKGVSQPTPSNYAISPRNLTPNTIRGTGEHRPRSSKRTTNAYKPPELEEIERD